MSDEQVIDWLRGRYPRLETVRPSVFRVVETHEGRPFAVRYFDVDPDIERLAVNIGEYQEELLGTSYFDAGASADLRWNHYLYLVPKAGFWRQSNSGAKVAIESNREYARKLVVDRNGLETALSTMPDPTSTSVGPLVDPLSEWLGVLDRHHLSFVVDDALTVPDVTRTVEEGSARPLVRAPQVPQLHGAELKVVDDHIQRLTIRGFRRFPLQREFDFSGVNLITGVNGVGKTSLLEAIEYLFCGKNLRAGPLLPRTSISGTLASSGLTLETKSTTEPARLRGRNLVWYGKSDLRAVKLHESFAKFNFLDADAAVRLSVDQSRDQLTEDLAQLLLGAEASKVLDRCLRVATQLSAGKKKLEDAIEARGYRRADAVLRLDEVKARPSDSDQLYSDLLTTLHDAGLRTLSKSKADVSEVGAVVEEALLEIEMLDSKSTRLVDLVNKEPLLRLKGAQETLIKMQSTAKSRAKAVALATSRRRRAERVLEAAEELRKMQQAEVPALLARRAALSPAITSGSESVAESAEAIVWLIGRKVKGRSLAQASQLCRAGMAEIDERIKAASIRLASVENAQTMLRSVRQRLHAAALAAIGLSPDSGRCPVCGAGYSSAELQLRLKNAVEEVVTEESAQVREELARAEDERRQTEADVRALDVAVAYFGSAAQSTSFADAKKVLDGMQQQQLADEKALEATELKLKQFAKQGWTAARWESLRSEVGSESSDASGEWLESRRSAAVVELEDAMQELARHDRDSLAADEQLEGFLLEHDIDAPGVSEAIGWVQKRIEAEERRQRALEAIGKRIEWAKTGSLTGAELGAKLQRARVVATECRTAMASEKHGAEAADRETKLIKEIDDDIAGLRVRLGRVDVASEVIGDLLSDQTERKMTDQVLQDNAARISFAFARIHSPNEFDVVSNGSFSIVRRGAEKVELTEMSSGQRAAYALSLFLAMNHRLGNGPNVVLFDDPIAHVDDINTLSFLDYLRDLALEGKRQIFFATADAKISALFARKFRFLGERFRQVELRRT